MIEIPYILAGPAKCFLFCVGWYSSSSSVALKGKGGVEEDLGMEVDVVAAVATVGVVVAAAAVAAAADPAIRCETYRYEWN